MLQQNKINQQYFTSAGFNPWVETELWPKVCGIRSHIPHPIGDEILPGEKRTKD